MKLVRAMQAPLIVLFAAGFIAGCAQPQYGNDSAIEDVAEGNIKNEGVRIVSAEEDMHFELTSDQSWDAPFNQSNGCLVEPTAHNYARAILTGAKRVRVHHPDFDEPLYGVLSLCGRVQGSTGPNANAYQIALTKGDLATVRNGGTAVVTAFQDFPQMRGAYAKVRAKSWTLWLSQSPMQQAAGYGRGHTLRAEVGKRVHDGFFGRLQIGGGGGPGFTNGTSAFSDEDFNHTGAGLSVLAAAGATLGENHSLHWTGRIQAMDYSAECASCGSWYEENRNKEPSYYDESIAAFSFFNGIGYTVYLRSNYFFTGAVGAVYSFWESPVVKGDFDDTFDEDQYRIVNDQYTGWGGGFDIQFGKEWWLGSQFGLGAAAFVAVDSAGNGAGSIFNQTMGLRISATLN